MAVSKPKKKKIYILISRLGASADSFIDSNDDGGLFDASLQLLPALMDQMNMSSEDGWTSEQQAAYDAASNMADALDPNATGKLDMQDLYDSLELAVSNL